LTAERTGIFEDPKVTVGAYLLEWLALKEWTLKASTWANYRSAVHKDLVPMFGAMRLSDLRSRHIEEWVADQLAKGRGRVALYRAAATLRSALSAAVRGRRLLYNPALYAVMSRPPPPSGRAGPRGRPRLSCGTTPRPTPTSCGTCSRYCWGQACDAARHSDCTGRTCT